MRRHGTGSRPCAAALVLAGCGGRAHAGADAAGAERAGDLAQRAGAGQAGGRDRGLPGVRPRGARGRRPGCRTWSSSCLGGGREVRLAGLRGRPMMINIWAQWCGPCRDEAPFIAEVANANDSELMILGVDYEDPRPDRAIEFARVLAWRFPQLVDQDKALAGPLQITGPPQTFFVRADGTIAGRHVGPFPSADADPQPGQGVPRGHPVTVDGLARPDWLRPLTDALADPSRLTAGRGPPAGSRRPAGRGADPDRRGTGGPEILFVERPTTMRTHAAQIAFPGGAADPDDVDLAATALREATEETGVDRVRHRDPRASCHRRTSRSAGSTSPRWSAGGPGPARSARSTPARWRRCWWCRWPGWSTRRNRAQVHHPSGYTGPAFVDRRPSDLGPDRPPARRRTRSRRLAAAVGPRAADRDPRPLPDRTARPRRTRCPLTTCSCSAGRDAADQPEIGEDLLRRYAEPHRRYHTVDHLADVLTKIDELAERPRGPVPGPAGGLVPRRRVRHPRRAGHQRGGLGPAGHPDAQPGRARAGGPDPGRPAGPAHRDPRARRPRPGGRAALRRRPGHPGGRAGGVRPLCRADPGGVRRGAGGAVPGRPAARADRPGRPRAVPDRPRAGG